jgi:hypothetical protein
MFCLEVFIVIEKMLKIYLDFVEGIACICHENYYDKDMIFL